MVIHVEPDGTAVVPVEMSQQDLAGGSHRTGGVEWNTHESKVLLEHYVRYVPQVGPDKKFRSKKEMFKRIADQIYEATGQRRTGEQCENRYKTIMRRKRRHSDFPSLSTARFLLRNAIAADSENHQMEEEEVEEEILEEGEVSRAEQQAEEGEQEDEEEEDNEPQLLLELAAMGDEEHQLARRSARRRAAGSALDQQQLLDRLHELHERRERRRDERERRRDLRHAEQMNLLRRILSVLERPPTTPSHVRVLSSSHR